MSDERIAKLPRWAQDHIRRLERDLEDLKAEHKSIAEGTTGIFWRGAEQNIHYLPEGTTVTLGGIEVDRRGEYVDVRALHGMLSVYPRAGNSIWVKSDR